MGREAVHGRHRHQHCRAFTAVHTRARHLPKFIGVCADVLMPLLLSFGDIFWETNAVYDFEASTTPNKFFADFGVEGSFKVTKLGNYPDFL